MTDPAIGAQEIARFGQPQAATRQHRRSDGCNAYTFEHGAGLLAITRASPATRILDLGTALGYPACVLATATERTDVDMIEADPPHVARTWGHIRDFNLDDLVTVHSGDFFDVMAELAGPYDLAFFDGLGPTLGIFEKLRSLLRPEGLPVCGNLALPAVPSGSPSPPSSDRPNDGGQLAASKREAPSYSARSIQSANANYERILK